MNLPLDRACALTGATLLEGERAPQELRVTTDTRRLEAGDAFLALRGENFNGHDFAGEAVRKGAALLIVDDADARIAGTATMVVERTERAYFALGGLARDLFTGRVLAITGSTGKTTTKSFLAQLCAAQYGERVAASRANENNEIGVAKLLLSLSNDVHEVAIVEMGARHYGDIALLVEMARPDVGILTNVGEAHLEIMGSRERLAETKWALFARGARAILNAGDAVSNERALPLEQQPHWFAATAAHEPHAEHAAPYPELERLTAIAGDHRLLERANGETVEYEIASHVPGMHNRLNLAAAAAGAVELGVPPARFIPAIPNLTLPDGRYDRIALAGGQRVIYDAYNANPSGMLAALDAFAAEAGSRRIAVLASMAELGEESPAMHERVGEHAARRVDVLLVSGEYAAELARGAIRAGLDPESIVTVDDNAQAAAWIREHAGDGDVVLLKGSRRYKLEQIVEELLA